MPGLSNKDMSRMSGDEIVASPVATPTQKNAAVPKASQQEPATTPQEYIKNTSYTPEHHPQATITVSDEVKSQPAAIPVQYQNPVPAAQPKSWLNNAVTTVDNGLDRAAEGVVGAYNTAKGAMVERGTELYNDASNVVKDYNGRISSAVNSIKGKLSNIVPPKVSMPSIPPLWGGHAAAQPQQPASAGYNQGNSMNSQLINAIIAGEGTSDEIARKQGYNSAYDVTLGFGRYADDKKVPVSSMTLNDLFSHQGKMLHAGNPHNSTASGKYQFTRRTLRDMAQRYGIDLNQKFTPEFQDKLAIMRMKEGGLDKYMASGRTPADRDELKNRMSGVWTSFKNAQGTNQTEGQVARTGHDVFDSILDKLDSGRTDQ